MILKKIWNFLWKSNSILSWIVDIILIFLILKFLLIPGVGLIFGTPVPLVIIESGSMEHQGSFDSWFALHGNWYKNNNLSKEVVYSWPFHNGMNKGDIIVVFGRKNKEYKLGEVIVFKVSQSSVPIIHRIIDIKQTSERIYSTKGDHNDGQHSYEQSIQKDQILGRAVFRIPYLGWIKLFLVNLIK